MATYITRFLSIYPEMPKQLVLAIPTYSTNAEKQAYLDSADIAGIKCLRLISESTAIALTYGYFKKAELSAGKQRIVCFIDFGHSKLTVTFASFLQGRTKILMTHSNRNLGGRNMDFIMF